MIPKNPLNDKDVDGNTMAWMEDQCGCSECKCDNNDDLDQ